MTKIRIPLIGLSFLYSAFIGCSSGHLTTERIQSTQTESVQSTTSSPPQETQNRWNVRPTNEIAPGFEIEIKEASDSKVNDVYRINSDGSLDLPYDVHVNAAGQSEKDLEKAVKDAYRGLIVNPTLKLEVKTREYYVDVRGLVKKPGIYLVRSNSSLDELISKGEGFLDGADRMNSSVQYARIEQLGVSNVIRLRDYYSGKKDLLPKWQGGETVFFQSERGDSASVSGIERNYVEVLGEVKKPSEYPFIRNGDFLAYLVKAGGPTQFANLEKVNIIRTDSSGRELITFSIEEADKLPAIQPGDTILVRADTPSDLEKRSRVIGGFSSVIQAIATIALLFTTL